MDATPQEPQLFELFSRAIAKGLEYVEAAKTGRTYVGTHDNWPTLEWRENGFPWITNTSFDTPKNYSHVIQGLYSALIGLGSSEIVLNFSKEPEFETLWRYANNHPRIGPYLLFGKSPDLGLVRLLGILGEVLDRYIHVNESLNFAEDKLLPIFLPIEKCLLDKTLPIEIMIPILSLRFALPQIELDERTVIKKITDELHLARGWRGDLAGSSMSVVESAATHALFVSNYAYENSHNWLSLSQTISNAGSYPIEFIDTIFAALRIVTGYPTGYAQLLTLPIGWACGYAATLTPLDGASVKSYPPSLEDGAWLKTAPVVDATMASQIVEVFQGLTQVLKGPHGRKVRRAIDRLNLSSIRTTDEDGLIDAMIAMEALLSDGKQEMTHKISMRLAAIYKTIDRGRTSDAFREMKLIYDLRSKVVHGDTIRDKDRVLNRNGKTIETLDAANEHLRTAFTVLIKHPTLLDPREIDSFLLTDKL